MSPVVDVHAHVIPRSALDEADTGNSWFGSMIERDGAGRPVAITNGRRMVFGSAEHFLPFHLRIERMDAQGVDIQVLSLIPPLFRYDLEPLVAADAARAINDELEELVDRWPTRFRALGTLPLGDPNLALAELERVMQSDAFIGVEIGTHVNGANLDDPRIERVLTACAALGAFVFCHPADPRGDAGTRSRFLGNVVGNPMETTLAIDSLILGGVLDRLPGLTVCLAHAGGYAAFGIGRLEHAYAVRDELRDTLRASPRDLLRRCFVDTLTHDERALRLVIDVMGAGQVALGSDYPADMGTADPVGDVASLAWLSDTDKAAILGGNVIGRVPRLAITGAAR
jgi:aminocarboxymuconate-semialdehyde decarboxylase